MRMPSPQTPVPSVENPTPTTLFPSFPFSFVLFFLRIASPSPSPLPLPLSTSRLLSPLLPFRRTLAKPKHALELTKNLLFFLQPDVSANNTRGASLQCRHTLRTIADSAVSGDRI